MLPKERLAIFILLLINFTHIVDFMIMMPLGPQFIDIFKITPSQFGLAVSAYGFMAGISSFGSAFFVDRFDRKHVLLLAYAGFLLGTFACAWAPTYEWLVAARILAGLFGGMISAQVLSIVSDLVPYERRASAMGLLMLGFSAASVLGVPGGLWIAANSSWHVPFLVVGVLGIFVWFCIFLWIPNVNGHLDKPRENPFRVILGFIQQPIQRVALACSFIIMLGHFAIIPYITPALVKNIGFPQDKIPFIYLIGGLLTVFSGPLVGRVADRVGKYPIFFIFAVLTLIPVWLITHVQHWPLWVVFTILASFFVFTNGRLIPFQAMISAATPPQQRGSFMSINSSLQQISTALAANIGGYMIAEGPNGELLNYDHVGIFSIVLGLMAIALASRLKPQETLANH